MVILGYNECAFYTINLIKINKHKIAYNYKMVLFGTIICTLLGKYRNMSCKKIIIIKTQCPLELKISITLQLNVSHFMEIFQAKYINIQYLDRIT